MNYETLLARVIDDGIAEVTQAYADAKEHHKRDGAIEAFEACRGKQPLEIYKLHEEAERDCRALFRREPNDDNARSYWRARYKQLQFEWVLNVLSAALIATGVRTTGILLHLPTLRGVMKYAGIVGVKGGGGDSVSVPGAGRIASAEVDRDPDVMLRSRRQAIDELQQLGDPVPGCGDGRGQGPEGAR